MDLSMKSVSKTDMTENDLQPKHSLASIKNEERDVDQNCNTAQQISSPLLSQTYLSDKTGEIVSSLLSIQSNSSMSEKIENSISEDHGTVMKEESLFPSIPLVSPPTVQPITSANSAPLLDSSKLLRPNRPSSSESADGFPHRVVGGDTSAPGSISPSPMAPYKELSWREKDRRRRFREEWKHTWLVVPHGRFEVMCLVCQKIMTQRKLDTIKRHTNRRHIEVMSLEDSERSQLFDQLAAKLGIQHEDNSDHITPRIVSTMGCHESTRENDTDHEVTPPGDSDMSRMFEMHKEDDTSAVSIDDRKTRAEDSKMDSFVGFDVASSLDDIKSTTNDEEHSPVLTLIGSIPTNQQKGHSWTNRKRGWGSDSLCGPMPSVTAKISNGNSIVQSSSRSSSATSRQGSPPAKQLRHSYSMASSDTISPSYPAPPSSCHTPHVTAPILASPTAHHYMPPITTSATTFKPLVLIPPTPSTTASHMGLSTSQHPSLHQHSPHSSDFLNLQHHLRLPHPFGAPFPSYNDPTLQPPPGFGSHQFEWPMPTSPPNSSLTAYTLFYQDLMRRHLQSQMSSSGPPHPHHLGSSGFPDFPHSPMRPPHPSPGHLHANSGPLLPSWCPTMPSGAPHLITPSLHSQQMLGNSTLSSTPAMKNELLAHYRGFTDKHSRDSNSHPVSSECSRSNSGSRHHSSKITPQSSLIRLEEPTKSTGLSSQSTSSVRKENTRGKSSSRDLEQMSIPSSKESHNQLGSHQRRKCSSPEAELDICGGLEDSGPSECNLKSAAGYLNGFVAKPLSDKPNESGCHSLDNKRLACPKSPHMDSNSNHERQYHQVEFSNSFDKPNSPNNHSSNLVNNHDQPHFRKSPCNSNPISPRHELSSRCKTPVSPNSQLKCYTNKTKSRSPILNNKLKSPNTELSLYNDKSSSPSNILNSYSNKSISPSNQLDSYNNKAISPNNQLDSYGNKPILPSNQLDSYGNKPISPSNQLDSYTRGSPCSSSLLSTTSPSVSSSSSSPNVDKTDLNVDRRSLPPSNNSTTFHSVMIPNGPLLCQVLRVPPGSEVWTSVEAVLLRKSWSSAFVLSSWGQVASVEIKTSSRSRFNDVSDVETVTKCVNKSTLTLTGPLNLLSLSGCFTLRSSLMNHYPPTHPIALSLADGEGRVTGGLLAGCLLAGEGGVELVLGNTEAFPSLDTFQSPVACCHWHSDHVTPQDTEVPYEKRVNNSFVSQSPPVTSTKDSKSPLHTDQVTISIPAAVEIVKCGKKTGQKATFCESYSYFRWKFSCEGDKGR